MMINFVNKNIMENYIRKLQHFLEESKVKTYSQGNFENSKIIKVYHILMDYKVV